MFSWQSSPEIALFSAPKHRIWRYDCGYCAIVVVVTLEPLRGRQFPVHGPVLVDTRTIRSSAENDTHATHGYGFPDWTSVQNLHLNNAEPGLIAIGEEKEVQPPRNIMNNFNNKSPDVRI